MCISYCFFTYRRYLINYDSFLRVFFSSFNTEVCLVCLKKNEIKQKEFLVFALWCSWSSINITADSFWFVCLILQFFIFQLVFSRTVSFLATVTNLRIRFHSSWLKNKQQTWQSASSTMLTVLLTSAALKQQRTSILVPGFSEVVEGHAAT